MIYFYDIFSSIRYEIYSLDYDDKLQILIFEVRNLKKIRDTNYLME